MTAAEDRPLTSAQVAAIFRVAQSTVIRWARDGKIDAFLTPGGTWRFRRAAVDELLREGSPS